MRTDRHGCSLRNVCNHHVENYTDPSSIRLHQLAAGDTSCQRTLPPTLDIVVCMHLYIFLLNFDANSNKISFFPADAAGSTRIPHIWRERFPGYESDRLRLPS